MRNQEMKWSDTAPSAGNRPDLEEHILGLGLSVRTKVPLTLFITLARLAVHQHPELREKLADETFAKAQWIEQTSAASAVAKTAARISKENGKLAGLVRDRQDLSAERQRLDTQYINVLTSPRDRRDNARELALKERLAEIDQQLIPISARLSQSFPDYNAIAQPQPLSAAAVQELLQPDEVLVKFISFDPLTFAWVVTKTETRWVHSNPGTVELTRDVKALRCGLDEEEWATPTKARVCADSLSLTELPDPSRALPFHLGKAHDLYRTLFGQIGDMIAGKRLLIVPSGPLTSLPFHVLVTKAPGTALPDNFEGYRDVAWLGKANAITTLPSVSSLKALRAHAANDHFTADTYLGYGDPVLNGDGSSCRQAKVPEKCPPADVAKQTAADAPVSAGRATIRGHGGRRSGRATTDDIFAEGVTTEAVLKQVRMLCPLPDTAYEIKCVGERFKEDARLIRLEADAREADIKALSQEGKLARYRILHFATHGLLSGDVEKMAQRQGEPALVMTPPDKPAGADDDGLLMASEVAMLKLNADWVVLSACNTAAGNQPGGQALSGLARAFFYAGGRALLVSHWPVYSDAAVRLTTAAFAELERNPKAGRAEALQHAMLDLMADTSQADNAHPAVWAPFIVVGEGGR